MIKILVNPVAGNGLALKVGRDVELALQNRGIPYEILYTQHPGHGAHLARQAADQGAEYVISVGGDGTIFEIARGLLHSNTSLAIIPAGTGNDVIKTLGIPAQPLAALDHALSRPARRVDAGLVNGELFVNECGTGFDVMALEYALHAKRYVRGLWPYLYGVIQALFRYQPMDVTLTLEDQTILSKKVTVCAIANGRYIGGGILIAPKADMHDGLFDVIIIGPKPRWKLPGLLPGLLSGKILSFPDTECFRCRSIGLNAPGMQLNIDGEIMLMDQAMFEIMPDALLVRA